MRFTLRFMDHLAMAKMAAEKIASINVVELVTPKNVNEQKAAWLAGGNFGRPHFRYDEARLEDISSWRPTFAAVRHLIQSEVIAVTEIGRWAKEMLLQRIDEAIMATEIAASIVLSQKCRGDDAVTAELIRQKYGCPNNNIVLAAYNKANGMPYPFEVEPTAISADERGQLEDMTFDAMEIADWFDRVIGFYGFQGWNVAVDSQFTAIDVRDKGINGPVVGVPTDRKVNGTKLLALIGHEIECHLRNTENSLSIWRTILGDDSPLDYFIPVLAKSDNETLYEGVAIVQDRKNGESAGLPWATIAIDQARRGGSFEEVAKVIYSLRVSAGASHDAALKGAWTTAYRIFRGAVDLGNSAKYAFTKDAAYLMGWEMVQSTDPVLLEYASMTLPEVQGMLNVGIPIGRVPHPYRNAVSWVKEQLL